MRIKSLFVAIALAVHLLISPASAVDTDGDGLLDLLDVPGFDPSASGFVDFGSRRIQDLDGASLLINLDSLYLGSNQITSIESGDFQELSDLLALLLLGNQITSLESGAFRGLKNLGTLNLVSNQITSIESGDFDGLTKLQVLNLNDNQITSLENGDFDGLNNLQRLDLWRNQIASIESGDFDGLNNLEQLELGGNQITSIETGDFDELNNLRSLFLGSNQITSIESGDFDGLTNLQELWLGENQITSIESGAFQGLNNLQSLWLHSNQITSIENGAFGGLKNLGTLNLWSNQLTSLENGDFDGLTELQHLDLGGNQTTSLESGAFRGLNNLQSLLLWGNRITELNFAGATFESLIWGSPNDNTGFRVDENEIASLILDDAVLSLGSLYAIVDQTISITDVSLVGLRFSDENPSDLSDLLGIGTLDNVTVSQTLFDSYADEFNIFAAMDGNTLTVVSDLGDYNANGVLDAGDLDLQAVAIQSGQHPKEFDLTYDHLVDIDDRTRWVHDFKNTYFGDADLDGDFDSGDLVIVLASGAYDTDIDSVWSTGDFNGDGRTTSADLVAALADGGFDQGPRVTVNAVPEPRNILMLVGIIGVILGRYRVGNERL